MMAIDLIFCVWFFFFFTTSPDLVGILRSKKTLPNFFFSIFFRFIVVSQGKIGNCPSFLTFSRALFGIADESSSDNLFSVYKNSFPVANVVIVGSNVHFAIFLCSFWSIELQHEKGKRRNHDGEGKNWEQGLEMEIYGERFG